MSKRIVIVSPSPPSSSFLDDLRNASGSEAEPLFLPHYPTRDELRTIGRDGAASLAFLIDCVQEGPAFRVLRDLSLVQPDAEAVILNGPRRLSTLIQAKQHGAAAYLSDFHSSADRLRLAAYLNSGWAPDGGNNGQGKVVSFLPALGGSGASTISLHVATSIGRRREGKCLLVDFDLHTGTVGFQLGLQPRRSLLSVMSQAVLSEDALRHAVTSTQGVDVLVGATVAEQPESGVFRRTTEFVSLIQQTYAYSFVDLPPATLSSAVDVLKRSHLVYLVCTPEITSLHLALRKLAFLQSSGVPSSNVRLLVNRASSWGRLDTERIEKVVGKPIEWLIDNDYRAVRQSALEGGLISPTSFLSQQFTHLGTEILRELDFVSEPDAAVLSHARDEIKTKIFA